MAHGFSKGEDPPHTHFGAHTTAWLEWEPTVSGEKLEGAEERGEFVLLSARARKAAGVRCCYLV